MKRKALSWRGAPLVLLVVSNVAGASLINLGPGSFTPDATITFGTVANYVTDPVYNVGGNTVSFGSHFSGQTVTAGSPKTITGTPTGGSLILVQDGNTQIVEDLMTPTTPVIAGKDGLILFKSPVSFAFANPVAFVGLSAGYFNNLGNTKIEAFDVTGASLGSVVNTVVGTNPSNGNEYFELADSGGASIAGISVYITGTEIDGIGVDNVSFKNAPTPAPEPGTLALLGLGLAGLAATRRRKQ